MTTNQNGSSGETDHPIFICLEGVETNIGTWQDRLVTTDQAWREFHDNPLAMALLACWTISSYGFIDHINDLEGNEKQPGMDSDHLLRVAGSMAIQVVDILVAKHNTELPDN